MSSDSNMKNMKSIVDIVRHTCDCDLTIDHHQSTPVQSPQFCAESNNSVKWSFTVKLFKYQMDDRFDDMLLELRAESTNIHETEERQYGGEVVFNVRSNIRNITCKKAFTYNEAGNEWRWQTKTVYTLLLSNEGYPLLSFDQELVLKFRCEITFFEISKLISLHTSYVPVNAAPLEPYSLEDFETLYLNKHLSDVTICIKVDENLKEYPAHKTILSARSKVFEAMFKHDMVENKFNRVIVEDIREEVFLETLRYIYTNKVQNLDTLVYELLPVADRYDLKKLKIYCGKVLSKKLSTKTVLEIVKLADTYNLDDVKIKAIRFIKEAEYFFNDNMDSTAWNDLLCRPQLVKDLLIWLNSGDILPIIGK